MNSVTVAGSVATVDLSAFPATDRVEETAAVQQLVWTVTANDPSITAVRVKVDGAPPVAHLDWSKPVRRGNSLPPCPTSGSSAPATGPRRAPP